MTETKTTRTRKPKSAPKADLIALAAEPVADVTTVEQAAEAAPVLEPTVSTTLKIEKSEPFAFSLRDQGETIRQAVRETVVTSAQGALEVNDKIIQALNDQGHAALDLWRATIDSSRQPGAFNVQSGAARQAFETVSAQWKDVAETTARWMTKSVEPLQSALLRQTR
ncbi:phasin family protein [Microvirga guangxiensis]|uniref:Phasin protein n=1 Tax=Microvirga guangxiensis TaxID=549386 RepID=A0A1G5KVW5_9HYPH|nr:phasin family protein [Microvirga guangxiensis]SCZ04494.1 Phasin protein [Microvirga guangxiensis]